MRDCPTAWLERSTTVSSLAGAELGRSRSIAGLPAGSVAATRPVAVSAGSSRLERFAARLQSARSSAHGGGDDRGGRGTQGICLHVRDAVCAGCGCAVLRGVCRRFWGIDPVHRTLSRRDDRRSRRRAERGEAHDVRLGRARAVRGAVLPPGVRVHAACGAAGGGALGRCGANAAQRALEALPHFHRRYHRCVPAHLRGRFRRRAVPGPAGAALCAGKLSRAALESDGRPRRSIGIAAAGHHRSVLDPAPPGSHRAGRLPGGAAARVLRAGARHALAPLEPLRPLCDRIGATGGGQCAAAFSAAAADHRRLL